VRLTYHGTPKDHFGGLDDGDPYIPPEFEREGFIHCTDGREAVSIVLTTYYKDSTGPWLVLYVDLDRVTAPVKYEDPAEVFPHIYGPLNRDAILAAREIRRAADGTFLQPDVL
jgi:uncharacterized protein (DUF952 family)